MKTFIINLNLGFLCNLPGGTMIKNPPANAGDAGLILVSSRSPGRGNGNPLEYLCLENTMHEEPGGLQFMDHKVRHD